MSAMISGVMLGLVLALLIGPVFFLLVDTAISKGFSSAIFIALGVILSDALFVLIAYFSSTTIRFIQGNQMLIGVGGGLVLIIFGLINIVRKPVLKENVLHLDNGGQWKGLAKGFLMNFLNPFVLIFWMGVAGSLAVQQKDSEAYPILFFSAALATVFITDLLKAWGAARLKRLIRPVYMRWLNVLSGLGLILFGLRLIWKLM